MKVAYALTIAGLAVLLAGCPSRHAGARLIYVPAPPVATVAGAKAQGGVMEIPAPPAPAEPEKAPKREEAVESAPSPPAAPRHRRASDRTEEAPAETVAPPPAEENPTAGAPELAPARSHAEQAQIEARIHDMQIAIRRRIAALSRKRLSGDDRKALEDARQFLVQSREATQEGDVQQALNLAQKADLLISAIEKRY